ncbi:MAG: UDP-2,3-diacylglucosamine diphosphatase [Bradymonadia bacterium]
MSDLTYFFSDVHFQTGNSVGQKAFLNCLDTLPEETRKIYFVGDLFDFWIGHARLPEAYLDLCDRLQRLTTQGVEIHVLTGNHDPAPMVQLRDKGVFVHTQPQTITLGNLKVWIEHGDLIDPSSVLRRYICRLARRPLIHRLCRLIPPNVAWKLASYYTSQPHQYTLPLHPELKTNWFTEKFQQGFDAVIIGHYHRALNTRLRTLDKSHQLIGLGDWLAQMTYARYDGRIDLLRFDPIDMRSTVVVPGDHCPP